MLRTIIIFLKMKYDLSLNRMVDFIRLAYSHYENTEDF